MMACAQYSLWSAARTTWILGAVAGALALSGCLAPDHHTVRGTLAAAARAVEDGDGRALFACIDERARNAMISTVRARQRAAAAISADYPEGERAAALSALGDAARVRDAEGLFAARCTVACMADLGARLGAPVAQVARGAELEVRTARGGTLRLYRGKTGAYGIVWNTDALSAERSRAAREWIQIQKNAEVSRRRRAIEAAR
jgi:hypothetical protein